MAAKTEDLEQLACALSSLDEAELKTVLERVFGPPSLCRSARERASYRERLVAAAQEHLAQRKEAEQQKTALVGEQKCGARAQECTCSLESELGLGLSEYQNCEYCGNISRGLINEGKCVICGERVMWAKFH
ncbi:MAG TPA: hypothetical protein PLP17_07710 [Oligoflexia bacterium]|nr:hypothetical protein [Oligoflexia bacterium]